MKQLKILLLLLSKLSLLAQFQTLPIIPKKALFLFNTMLLQIFKVLCVLQYNREINNLEANSVLHKVLQFCFYQLFFDLLINLKPTSRIFLISLHGENNGIFRMRLCHCIILTIFFHRDEQA
jgi:hypothetical protein